MDGRSGVLWVYETPLMKLSGGGKLLYLMRRFQHLSQGKAPFHEGLQKKSLTKAAQLRVSAKEL